MFCSRLHGFPKTCMLILVTFAKTQACSCPLLCTERVGWCHTWCCSRNLSLFRMLFSASEYHLHEVHTVISEDANRRGHSCSCWCLFIYLVLLQTSLHMHAPALERASSTNDGSTFPRWSVALHYIPVPGPWVNVLCSVVAGVSAAAMTTAITGCEVRERGPPPRPAAHSSKILSSGSKQNPPHE